MYVSDIYRRGYLYVRHLQEGYLYVSDIYRRVTFM